MTRFYKKDEISKRFAVFFLGNMVANAGAGLLAFGMYVSPFGNPLLLITLTFLKPKNERDCKSIRLAVALSYKHTIPLSSSIGN